MNPDPRFTPRPVTRLASREQLQEPKFSVIEAAKILNVSKMAVYRLVSPPKGKPPLRHYRIGNVVRIPLSALREYLGDVEQGGEE